jgi:hypothetical protein
MNAPWKMTVAARTAFRSQVYRFPGARADVPHKYSDAVTPHPPAAFPPARPGNGERPSPGGDGRSDGVARDLAYRL